MKEPHESKLLSILFSLSIGVIIICMWFSVTNCSPESVTLLSVILLLFRLILGGIIIVCCILKTHKATQLFVGLLLVVWGITSILVDYVFPFSIREFWPVYGILAGIMLFISGFYKYEKAKFGYVIPSVTLIGMGLWYSFFSFKIIKKSFLAVVTNLGPVFMLLIALSLVILFLVQQKHKKFVLPDDDPGIFSDEDDGIIKRED